MLYEGETTPLRYTSGIGKSSPRCIVRLHIRVPFLKRALTWFERILGMPEKRLPKQCVAALLQKDA